VPFLREATRSAHREVAHRAGQCLGEITSAPEASILAAAVRCLVRRHPQETVAVLLEFFPFAGEEWVEDEVLTGLGTLGVKSGKPEPALQTALQDPAAGAPGSGRRRRCPLGRPCPAAGRASGCLPTPT